MQATSPIITTRSRQSLLTMFMTLLLVMATVAPALGSSRTAHAAPVAATTATTCTQCTTSVSGAVTAYVKATATANGYITIGGVKYVIKAGTTLSSLIKVGVYVSLRLTLNASGQITACTVLSVKVKVSGTVNAYVKATSTANGSITIGGVKYVIKAGTVLSAAIKLNAYVNLTLTLNGSNQITACAVISVKLNVSGTVSAYVKATSTANGSITIGGVKYVIKAGTTLSTGIKVGAYVNLTLTLNGSNQVTVCTVISVKVKVSGTVTAYVKATASTNGYIVIGGVKYVIKAGTTLSALVKIGAVVNVTLTLNGSNQVVACAVISVKLKVTGTVSAYVKATATANGYVTIGGVKYVIKAGTTLPSTIKVGAYVTVTLTLNGSSQVIACTVLSVKVSGLITVFVPATLLTTGQLVIGGQSFVIAKGASLSLAVGLNVTLTLTLNSAGQVTSCGCN